MVVHLTESVPVAVRTAGFSLAYSLATTIGGSTPAVVTYLIHETGNRAMPGAWISLAAGIAVPAAWVSRPPENRGPQRPLRRRVCQTNSAGALNACPAGRNQTQTHRAQRALSPQ